MLYYGLIKQSTGEDWLDAKLSLSTANPSIGGCVPELGVQLLKFKQPVIVPKPPKYSCHAMNKHSCRAVNKSFPTTGFNIFG